MSSPEADVAKTVNALERQEGRQPYPKDTVVAKSAADVAEGYTIIRFRGRPMVMMDKPFPHFVPLHRERFDQMAYPVLGGVSRSRMGDVFAFLGNTAQDMTANEKFILFGVPLADYDVESDTDLTHIAKYRPAAWDMQELAVDRIVDPAQCVWRSPYPRVPLEDGERLEFVLQLAGGNEDVYDDIMQSIAPLIMDKKPDGVVWWVGDGANGKSTLMDALYKLFPGQLSSITVKRLTDGRDTPSLNGTLGNIVKESSEGRIDDTEVYKSIGTHENFRVHKFHSQDDIEIRGNVHHIFSANVIPTFNDKGYAARRRTFIIPFKERFDSDPTFEERTFTPEFFGHLISELQRYAQQIKAQGYRYKFSAITLAAKADYDAEASNAEEYAKHIISEGIVAFDSFGPVKLDYENWCAEMGYVPLGVGNLRRAMQACGFERITYRDFTGTQGKRYRLPNVADDELVSAGMGKQGMYTTPGFEKKAEPEPSTPAEKKEQASILEGW